jgi:hypothetical protein
MMRNIEIAQIPHERCENSSSEAEAVVDVAPPVLNAPARVNETGVALKRGPFRNTIAHAGVESPRHFHISRRAAAGTGGDGQSRHRQSQRGFDVLQKIAAPKKEGLLYNVAFCAAPKVFFLAKSWSRTA